MNTLSTNNEVYSPEQFKKCELFPYKKKTVSLLTIETKSHKRIKEKVNSMKNFSINHYSTYSMNDKTKKLSLNNFIIHSNLTGIRSIIDEHNKNIVPPYNNTKPIKNYYSAFVKNE